MQTGGSQPNEESKGEKPAEPGGPIKDAQDNKIQTEERNKDQTGKLNSAQTSAKTVAPGTGYSVKCFESFTGFYVKKVVSPFIICLIMSRLLLIIMIGQEPANFSSIFNLHCAKLPKLHVAHVK